MNNNEIIQISNLTKEFKEKTALDQISLTISQGELFGLVGPDGAGKTTFLRILAGIMSISDGEVLISGIDLSRDPEANKPRAGYMAQEFSLYDKLSVMENLVFFGDLYNVTKTQQAERIPRLQRRKSGVLTPLFLCPL